MYGGRGGNVPWNFEKKRWISAAREGATTMIRKFKK
jgi:hypothetical protein